MESVGHIFVRILLKSVRSAWNMIKWSLDLQFLLNEFHKQWGTDRQKCSAWKLWGTLATITLLESCYRVTSSTLVNQKGGQKGLCSQKLQLWGCCDWVGKLFPGCPCPILECWFQTWYLHCWSGFLLVHAPGNSRWCLKCLGPCHPDGRSGWSFRLLASAGPLLTVVGIWGENQQLEDSFGICFSRRWKHLSKH